MQRPADDLPAPPLDTQSPQRPDCAGYMPALRGTQEVAGLTPVRCSRQRKREGRRLDQGRQGAASSKGEGVRSLIRWTSGRTLVLGRQHRMRRWLLVDTSFGPVTKLSFIWYRPLGVTLSALIVGRRISYVRD
jgi:hypothetical protein